MMPGVHTPHAPGAAMVPGLARCGHVPGPGQCGRLHCGRVRNMATSRDLNAETAEDGGRLGDRGVSQTQAGAQHRTLNICRYM